MRATKILMVVLLSYAGFVWVSATQYYGCWVVDLYHEERNHQGLHDRLIFPEPTGPPNGPIRCRTRLGELLRYYSPRRLMTRLNFRIVRQ